jgi:small subunit ribosomal protein S20
VRRGRLLATTGAQHRNGTLMANTKSAKKATRKIARRTEVNKTRRSRMRSYLRMVEDAIAGGDKAKAQSALKAAEPEMMRAAQRGVIHKKTASRRVSRLTQQIGKLGQ